MARLHVDGSELVVGLSALEKLGAFRGELRVPLGAVLSAELEPHPWRALRGMRAPGTGVPGVIAYGVRRRLDGHPDFAAVFAGRPAVKVELDETSPYARLLVTVRDAEASARAVRLAGGI